MGGGCKVPERGAVDVKSSCWSRAGTVLQSQISVCIT